MGDIFHTGIEEPTSITTWKFSRIFVPLVYQIFNNFLLFLDSERMPFYVTCITQVQERLNFLSTILLSSSLRMFSHAWSFSGLMPAFCPSFCLSRSVQFLWIGWDREQERVPTYCSAVFHIWRCYCTRIGCAYFCLQCSTCVAWVIEYYIKKLFWLASCLYRHHFVLHSVGIDIDVYVRMYVCMFVRMFIFLYVWNIYSCTNTHIAYSAYPNAHANLHTLRLIYTCLFVCARVCACFSFVVLYIFLLWKTKRLFSIEETVYQLAN